MYQILLLLIVVIPAILFLITQQNTLKAVQPENRLMHPGQVWLQIIPLVGQAWQFIVVRRIADSISRELSSVNDDSILGISKEELETVDIKPTLKAGMAYSILTAIYIIFNFIFRMEMILHSPNAQVFAIVILALALSVMVCWIIYWVALGKYLKILRRKSLLIA